MNTLKINVALCLNLAVLLVLCLSVEQSSAGALKWASDYTGGVKTYLVNLAKSKVISNNEVLRSFNEAMERVKERYAIALENMSPEEKAEDHSDFYYKLVIEEMRDLREKYEPLAKQQQVAAANDANESEVIEDADESELINELDKQLESLENEAEMGWSMSPENKAALKKRTAIVVQELLDSELRQLAAAMLMSYMSGSPMAPVIVAIGNSLKYKLVQYLMNAVLDILRNTFGQPIQVEPVEPMPASQPSGEAKV